MKNFILAMALLVGTFAFASFPVYNSQEGNATTTENNQVNAKPESSAANMQSTATVQKNETSRDNDASAITPVAKGGYDKWVAIALWFFLGAFAAHRWYRGKPVLYNIIFILTLGGLGIWWIIDLINILTDKF